MPVQEAPEDRVRVLVIDDSEIVLESVRTTLEGAGFVVDTRNAAYGSAWEILARRPDVVLVDVNMPGLPGPEIVAIARSRSDLRDTRVLLFSSEPESKLESLTRECGADGWIRKTANHGELADWVRRWAGRPAAPTRPSTPERRLLFVDHEPAALAFYRDTFRSRASEADFVGSGAEAWGSIISSPPPSLIVCEIALRGLTGPDLYRRALDRDPSWKDRFLFITGAASSLGWVAAFINGLGAPVLHKPISAAHLGDAVERRLGASGHPQP